jgi:mRNA-degrading endonuclease YafQ of YafQ-DinJ toxin-antitoxin module
LTRTGFGFGGDFLLIYRLENRGAHELIIFARTGSRADIFE